MIAIDIYRAKDGWRWRMRRKGRIIAEGGEAYQRRAGCVRTLKRLLESVVQLDYHITGEEKSIDRRRTDQTT